MLFRGRENHHHWSPEGYTIASVPAGISEIWGFVLMWIVLYYRATELSADLFLKTSVHEYTSVPNPEDDVEEKKSIV